MAWPARSASHAAEPWLLGWDTLTSFCRLVSFGSAGFKCIQLAGQGLALLLADYLPSGLQRFGASVRNGFQIGQQVCALVGINKLNGLDRFGRDVLCRLAGRARIDMALHDPLSFTLLINADIAERQASALDHRLVAQHAAGVRPLGLRAARAFDHVFPGLDRIAAVLAVDDAFNRLAVLVGVAVNDPGPAVDPDNRDDAVVLVGEGVDLLRPWIQALLRNRDQEGGHLCVRDLALECGCLEDCGQFAESGIASFADVIPQFGNRPVQCLDFLSGTPVCAMLF